MGAGGTDGWERRPLRVAARVARVRLSKLNGGCGALRLAIWADAGRTRPADPTRESPLLIFLRAEARVPRSAAVIGWACVTYVQRV